MHKDGHICSFLKDFCIRAIVDKLQQLVKNLLDVLDLLKVRRYQRHLGYHFLFFCSETLLEFILKFCLFFNEFFLQVSEAFIDIF